MATTTTQGTSLEILAPYLPYGIEIQNSQGKRSRLIRLDINDRAESIVVEAGYVGDPSLALPVLRPFSHLCHQLPDGTVPACVLAQLVVADDVLLQDATAVLDDGDYDEDTDTEYAPDAIYVSAKDEFTGERVEVTIYSDWSCDQITYAPAAYINYLRSQHFAVGLEPHQYVEKTAPAPTLEKEQAL